MKMNKNIEWKKSSIDYSKLSELSHAQLMKIQNGNLAKESGQFYEAMSKGGKAVIEKLNQKNKKTNHWLKLGDSKIGVPRDEETKKKIQSGTQHSWRDISQYTKDGMWLADYINFTQIENKYPTFSRTNICNCCKHYELKKEGFKSSYGFVWKYKE